jgi:hopanoid biosynthesis associated protein HpnK
LIVNADDFGLSPGVSRGILAGFREGIVSSTTMLVNLPYFEDAVGLARANPDLPVGVHLTLLWGAPVSDPAAVSTLVDREGRLPRGLGPLVSRYVLGRLALDEVRSEFRSQVRKFLDTGLRPTHLDTHKHVHCLPGVFDAVVEVAREFGIGGVRLPRERSLAAAPGSNGTAAPARPPWRPRAKRQAVRFLCRRARAKLDRAGLRTTDHFVGLDYMARLDAAALRFILASLPEGTTEIMCHPGRFDAPAREYSSVPPHREQELQGLTDAAVKDCLVSRSIRLIHFGNL